MGETTRISILLRLLEKYIHMNKKEKQVKVFNLLVDELNEFTGLDLRHEWETYIGPDAEKFEMLVKSNL